MISIELNISVHFPCEQLSIPLLFQPLIVVSFSDLQNYLVSTLYSIIFLRNHGWDEIRHACVASLWLCEMKDELRPAYALFQALP